MTVSVSELPNCVERHGPASASSQCGAARIGPRALGSQEGVRAVVLGVSMGKTVFSANSAGAAEGLSQNPGPSPHLPPRAKADVKNVIN